MGKQAFTRKQARGRAGAASGRGDDRQWRGQILPDGTLVLKAAPRAAPSAWPPHPLDIDIRRIPHQTRHLSAGGRDVKAYIADCPDGCGVVAWTDTMLPFTAPGTEAAEAAIIRSYSK